MENFRKYGPLIIVLSIILIIVGIYFFWIPKYNDYGESKEVLKVRSGEFNRKSAYLSDMEIKLGALNDYAEELAIINAGIPVYDFSEITLFNFIQKVSSENGLVLNSLEVALKKNEKSQAAQNASLSGAGSWNMRDFIFNATVAGSYRSFKAFLDKIYFNSRLIDVNSITFGSTDKNDIVDFDLELSAKYYLWEQAQAALNPNI